MLLVMSLGVPASGRTQSAPSDPFAYTGLENGMQRSAGRFTVIADARDARLAQSLLADALARDSFPGLPRPRAAVLIAIAPDAKRFREWIGESAPEWGAAVAFPERQRIVMQGSRAGADAGNPLVVLRHELAHLALHETVGELAPRWFDEGYASVSAGEWNREIALETSVTMMWRVLPSRSQLEEGFYGGATQAQWSYALAHRVVSEMQAIDANNGLRNFFTHWQETRSFESALRLAYGMTGTQFDRYWHSRTRQRYGALAIIANLSLIMGVFGILLGPLFVARRRRDRRRLAMMREAEVAQEAAQEAAFRASALAAIMEAMEENRVFAGNSGDGSGSPPCRPVGESDILPS